MTSTVVLKAAGLSLSPNQLNLEDGALKTANNVIIKRDGVIESRRGYSIYGDATDTPSHLIKQLHVYRQRLLRHYDDVLEWDDGTGNFTAFTKSVMETQTGLRTKSIESNGNFYLTTSEGIKKISIADSSGYSTAEIVNAGGVKATDFTTTVEYVLGNQAGFLPSNSTVAYRTLWATKDANKNLILGNPSQRQVIYNPLMYTLVQDYMQVLARLDQITDNTNLTRIGDGNYINTLKVIANATASELRNAAIALATKIDTDIQYAEVGATCAIDITAKTYTTVGATAPRVCTLNIDNLDDFIQAGQWIELKGFTDTAMNEKVQIVTISGTQITFATNGAAAVGTVVNAGAKIYSADFQKITQPVIPSTSPTDDELKELQTYVSDIIIKLQDLPQTTLLTGIVVTTANKVIIDELDISLTNNVSLDVTIPQDVVNAGEGVYFLQIYRSPTISASGVSVLSDLAPSDELQLVYEIFPTTTDLSAGTVSFLDETPDQFLGANLYTNPTTGEGILQANDLPPFAKDINRFKNYVFYANTKTRQRLTISLIGVTKIIDKLATASCTITIGTQTYTFVLGKQEISTLACVADVANSLNGKYFDLYSANNKKAYRFYFKTSAGTDTPPSSTGKTLVRIGITTGSSSTVVGEKVRDALNVYLTDFSASATTGTVTITNTNEGYCTDLSAGTSGFTPVVSQQGVGEDIASKKVLVSSVVSPAQAVDYTARSLVRIINKNSSDVTYAYYLSSSTDVPGKILLETRDLPTAAFNVICNNTETGSSFNPDLTTTSTSENEVKPNRIYYSKIYQPEAVPIVNYFDVGAEEQEILRIFPLRDSLFVFKQDALYRISGETAPFSVALFDSSCDLVAPDSVSVANNYLYGWTTQGLAVVSESLTQIVSRPIDIQILPLSTPNYSAFPTATWGVGYESDNSYTVYTVNKTTDTVATIGYRYSNLTNSWTTIDKTTTCGILNGFDDKLYLGAGDVNYIEKERKSFTRLDYCDREYSDLLSSGRYSGVVVRLNTLTNISVGDVIQQTQGVSLSQFNSLLRKLDADAQTVYKNYYTDFVVSNGGNVKTALQNVAAKLDATVVPTPAPTYVSVLSAGSTLTDIKHDYNAIVAKLNLDQGIAGNNFLTAIESSFEAVIISIKNSTKEITLSYAAPFYIGAISFFESIDCSFTYAPITMGDPVNWKHLREATVMLESRAITAAKLSFSTDLLPEYLAVDFLLDGNGTFGSGTFGNSFFGGGSNSAPLRTIIPRQAQRCRYILIRFNHKVSREKFSVFGATITGEILQSSRAYR